MGSRCGVKVICIGRDIQLLQQLTGMAMAKESVCGEVVRRIHEMRLRGRLLACAGDAGLRIADDATIHVHPAGGHERLKRENDGGRVAAGIGHQPRL